MKIFTKILTAILSITMLFSVVGFSACTNGDLEAKIAELEAQIATLEQEKQELGDQIEYLESQIDSKIEFSTEWVIVDVKEEYKEAFLNEEITVEDFSWDNVERIEYGSWNINTFLESGSLKVYLINAGERQVLNAVNHFNTLDFVYLAWFDYIVHLA